ncbi:MULTISPECIES: hypothetical protein [Vagococcus]|uniref:Alternate signal-mediated exported protein, CPF_0494 family n=1 Tax=Vagococcus fluvialis bH819 TaxID=1255619 RepID=A0A1X6WLW4_9ENTE|nr:MULTISPECIES: hypothetical protein [Vagococcus]SLM85232.1 hypothetical protein FM121_03975 [Vagococcus fluvialis bH819]HCM88354.1 hypothetical protein [Vagococcus sp.]
MKKMFGVFSKKRNIFLGIVILVCLLSLISLNYIYASLIDSDQKTNDFQIANLKGEIVEKFTPPTTNKPIGPGDTYKKEVKVSNTSELDFFVRLLVTPEIQSSDGELLPSEFGKQLLAVINPDWILGEDGYYYYIKKVLPGENTPPLFSSITIPNTLSSYSSKYKNSSLKITIKSETISSSSDIYRSAWWNGQQPTDEKLKLIDTKLQSIL